MKAANDLRIPFAWKDRHPVLLERFLYVPSFYGAHEEWSPIPWSDPQIFGNDRPIALEYCSGNGQWICQKAKQNPHLNWVALDIRFDRSRKTWARLHRENLSNLYILCGDAATLTRYYIPKSSLVEIFVNFPDPWPKLRHAKNRLIQAPFLKEAAEVVQPKGLATFVTDDETYAAQMLRELAACPIWSPRLPPPHYELNPAAFGASFFSDLWIKKGRDIRFIPFQRSL